MANAYPLEWPAGWPRHKGAREVARFEKQRSTYDTELRRTTTSRSTLTIADGLDRVRATLRRMSVHEATVVVSSNVQLRQDGFPRSGKGENPADPGVAVYWARRGESKVMAVDRFTRVGDNLAAIAASLEALRGIERWGGGQILDRAFSGFTALPAPGASTVRGWREILGVGPSESNLDFVKDKYRRLSAVHHPDRGGTQEAMSEINSAWSQAQAALAQGVSR